MMYIYLKFHEIPLRGYLVIANYMDFFYQFKGYNSWTTNASLTKLHLHQCLVVIYIYLKFHEIRVGGYIVIANYMAFWSIQGL